MDKRLPLRTLARLALALDDPQLAADCHIDLLVVADAPNNANPPRPLLRVTHRPTNLAVEVEMRRSQPQTLLVALARLRNLLYDTTKGYLDGGAPPLRKVGTSDAGDR